MTTPASDHTRIAPGGLLLGIGAYVLWGILPFYFHLLADVPAEQVVAHRVLWSLLLLGLVVVALRRSKPMAGALTRRIFVTLTGSAMLIASNWLVYVWAVQHGHVLAASLGYFINPLVNVALGVLVLGERLRRAQGLAILVTVAGVAVLAVGGGGGSLLISLTLAATFGLYGLLRKVVAIDALGGLSVETLILAPLAFGVLWHAGASGQAAFGRSNGTDLLLILSGAVTAVPMLMFAAAARRMPYSTPGQLQYIGRHYNSSRRCSSASRCGRSMSPPSRSSGAAARPMRGTLSGAPGRGHPHRSRQTQTRGRHAPPRALHHQRMRSKLPADPRSSPHQRRCGPAQA